MFNYLPYSSHITPVMTSQDTVTISQTGPTIAEGPTKLRVRRKPPPPHRISTAQRKQSEGQSDKRDGQQLALSSTPSRGPDVLKLCI
jgi:hypothetical protein